MSDHAGYIFAAFAVTAAVVAIMLGAILLDHRRLTRALAKLPSRSERDGA
jgi:heme exporter protein CcmD